jgi:hypothetical protein
VSTATPSGTFGAVPDTSPRHPGYVASIACGVVGAVLLIAGAVFRSNGVAVAGFVAGAVSLVSALIWRADLVASWRAAHRRPPTG